MPDFAGKKKEKLPAKAASRVDFFADFLITRQQSWTRYHHKLITRQQSWTRYRTSNGDSDPRAKLKPEHLTRGRLFVGLEFPVLR